jgi:peptide deformylase
MTMHKILTEPDPILRKKCTSLEKVDDNLRNLMRDMLETMYKAPGIGLAAIQIGILKRLVVIDIAKENEKKNPLFLVNPEIISLSKNTSIYEEGCLSLPGQYAEVERPAECQIKYLDFYGKIKELKTEGILATCIQHEIDHLNGILFIDYLSKLKKTMIIKKLIKQKKSLERIVV